MKVEISVLDNHGGKYYLYLLALSLNSVQVNKQPIMPSHDRNDDPPRRRRQRQRQTLDISLIEDMTNDSGKTLHTKDGQVFVYCSIFVLSKYLSIIFFNMHVYLTFNTSTLKKLCLVIFLI